VSPERVQSQLTLGYISEDDSGIPDLLGLGDLTGLWTQLCTRPAGVAWRYWLGMGFVLYFGADGFPQKCFCWGRVLLAARDWV